MDLPEKIVKFSDNNRYIFLQKSSNFSAKQNQLFIEKSSEFSFENHQNLLNSMKFVITGDDRRMQVCSISTYNYFFMIEIIRTAHSIIPVTHLRKTGISVPPYVFILKDHSDYT